MHQTLGSGLINSLHCDLVSALGLGAIAFNGSSLELLNSSLQCGLLGLIASTSHLCNQYTLFSRLNIRQTKHLLGDKFALRTKNTSTQVSILSYSLNNCKEFFKNN